MQREPPSHIDILIVGAGLGGLYAAIECHRQGHSVRVLEGKPELEGLGLTPFHKVLRLNALTDSSSGDFVGIGPSVVNQFKKWPPMSETYSSIIYRPMMNLLTYNGDFLGGPFPLSESSHHRPVPVSRAKLIQALYDYVTSLDIPVIFDKRVVNYEESDRTKQAYAVTDKGERFEADIVVAADGIQSKVIKAILLK